MICPGCEVGQHTCGEGSPCECDTCPRKQPQRRVTAGKNDGSITPVRFYTVAEAEAWIAEREKTDGASVEHGDYYIDAPEELVNSHYSKLKDDEIINLKTALLELQGFAKRNLDRADKAAAAARGYYEAGHKERIEADARFHEAHRVFQVIDMRVKEALR